MAKRRNFSPDFKARVALAVIRGGPRGTVQAEIWRHALPCGSQGPFHALAPERLRPAGLVSTSQGLEPLGNPVRFKNGEFGIPVPVTWIVASST